MVLDISLVICTKSMAEDLGDFGGLLSGIEYCILYAITEGIYGR